VGKVSICKIDWIQVRAGEIDAGESRSSKNGRREGVTEICGGASAIVVPLEVVVETTVKPERIPFVSVWIIETIGAKAGRHCGLEFRAE
jgi:hypothetical protein